MRKLSKGSSSNPKYPGSLQNKKIDKQKLKEDIEREFKFKKDLQEAIKSNKIKFKEESIKKKGKIKELIEVTPKEGKLYSKLIDKSQLNKNPKKDKDYLSIKDPKLKEGLKALIKVSKKEDKLKKSKSKKEIQPIDKAKLKADIESTFKPKKELVKIDSKEDKNKNLSDIKKAIEKELSAPKAKKQQGNKSYIKTNIPGFDELFEQGIPKGNSVLVAGGAGSGKTIFCLQLLKNQANAGKKCLYMSFEESEEKLIQHMEDFGWEPKKLIKSGNLLIKRFNPFDITREVDALLMQAKGELLIDIDPIIYPTKFIPDFIVLDSLTAIASAFTGKEESYRIYIEQLFRFFEKGKSTSFLITETEQTPKIYSTTGVEEFLADGVIVLYNFKRGDTRESAVEVLKMRGESHQKKIVAMQVGIEGITVYPEQEIFSDIEEK